MVKKDIQPLLKEIRRDQKYKRLRLSFDEAPMYQLPLDKLIEEVETAHKLRSIRRLNSQDPGFVDAVVVANTLDQGTRSRLTEILMSCARAISTLDRAVEALKQYLLITYSNELKSFRTKEERSMVINMALAPFIRYVERVETLKNIVDLVIVDIDKGGWSLRTSIEVLKIHTSKERTL